MITVEPMDGVIVSEFAQRMAKAVVDVLNAKGSNTELLMAMMGEVVLEIDEIGKRVSVLEASNGR
jgi:hypothetical protein